MTAIRHPAVAGTFYPAERDVLERQLALFLSEAGNEAPSPSAAQGDHRSACRLRVFRRGRRACLCAPGRRARADQPRRADRAVALRGVPRPRRRYRGGLGDAGRHRRAGYRGDRPAARAADGRRARRRVSARACAGGARAVPAARAGRVPPGPDRRRRRAARGGRRGARRAVGRAGDADRGVHRPVALPRLRRLPAGSTSPPPRRSSGSIAAITPTAGLRGGADARPAAGGAAARA